MAREQHRVAWPIRKRGDLHHHFGQPIIKVVAKAARGDHRVEIAVGRADDPRIDRDRLASADALDSPFLKETQQLDLPGQRNVDDLVEEQSAAVRQLDLALGRLYSAGERSLSVTEKYDFGQIYGDGGVAERKRE